MKTPDKEPTQHDITELFHTLCIACQIPWLEPDERGEPATAIPAHGDYLVMRCMERFPVKVYQIKGHTALTDDINLVLTGELEAYNVLTWMVRAAHWGRWGEQMHAGKMSVKARKAALIEKTVLAAMGLDESEGGA